MANTGILLRRDWFCSPTYIIYAEVVFKHQCTALVGLRIEDPTASDEAEEICSGSKPFIGINSPRKLALFVKGRAAFTVLTTPSRLQ